MNKLRRPIRAIKVHRNLQLLFIDFNEVVGDYLLMVVNNMSMAFIVFISFGLIRMHSHIQPTFFVALFLSGFDVFAFLVLSYTKLGDINQRSKEYHGSWKGAAGYLKPPMRTRMEKFIRSSRPLRIQFSEFGYYSKPASGRIVGKVLTYVVRFLMLTSKFGIWERELIIHVDTIHVHFWSAWFIILRKYSCETDSLYNYQALLKIFTKCIKQMEKNWTLWIENNLEMHFHKILLLYYL